MRAKGREGGREEGREGGREELGSCSPTMFDGVSKENEAHGDKARLHVVVLQLLLHQLLEVGKLCDALRDLNVVSPHEVTW